MSIYVAFHIITILAVAAVNTGNGILFGLVLFWLSAHKYPEVKLINCMVVLFLTF